jgi:hypothetical protein
MRELCVASAKPIAYVDAAHGVGRRLDMGELQDV